MAPGVCLAAMASATRSSTRSRPDDCPAAISLRVAARPKTNAARPVCSVRTMVATILSWSFYQREIQAMRDSKTFLSAAALVAALMVAAVPAMAQTGRIGGTVKDQNNQPLKGATVTAENPNASPSSFTATTDDRGRYSIIGLRTGAWKITASAPGFQASSGSVPVRTIGAPMPPVDFVLAPGASEIGRAHV